jgi:hypothetical protein
MHRRYQGLDTRIHPQEAARVEKFCVTLFLRKIDWEQLLYRKL